MSKQSFKERNYQIQLHHIALAIREWGPETGYPIIALHGWLDNSATYEPLIGNTDWLTEHNLRFIAVDSAGHGHSEHRPKGQSYMLLDNVDDLHQLILTLNLEQAPVLLGHSMGGGIATIYAGTDSAELSCLILIEALGPYSNNISDAPEQLTKHIQNRHRHQRQEKMVYEDLKPIVQLRAKNSDLPEEFVELLIRRNMRQDADGFHWRSDPRLRIPSAMYLSHEHVEAFVANISCPTLIIYAEDGPWPNYPVLGSRAELLKHKEMVGLTGGHHLHITNQSEVRDEIVKYILKTVH